MPQPRGTLARASSTGERLARVPALSPPFAVALLAVAAIAATRLRWVRRPERATPPRPILAPLCWYGIGMLLGPALGLLDHQLLEGVTPALILATGWVAARAGGEAATPGHGDRAPGGRVGALTDAVAAWLVPAALLYAAARLLPASLAPGWAPRLPVIGVLAGAVAVASGASRRLTTVVALWAMVGALVAPLPHGKVLDLPRQAVWIGLAVAGVALTVVLWEWITRRATLPLGGAVAGMAIGAGVGLATGASAVVVCALAGAIVARRQPSGPALGTDLARSEAPASAMLWVAAGAQAGGPLAVIVSAAVALALWPVARRLTFRTAAPADHTLGLALVLSYVWATGQDRPGPLVTAAAIAVLLAGAVPARDRPVPSRLTSGLAPAEVSV